MLREKKECRLGIVSSVILAMAILAFGGRVCLAGEGEIEAWGWNNNGQCSVPELNAHFVAVAGATYHSLGVKADGSIAAWGSNSDGQCTVPSPNADFVAVAAGDRHSLGLKADGSIAAWGANDGGQCNVPSPNADFIAVAAGLSHSLGLKADGSIAAWGSNVYGQCNVPSINADFAAVAGGGYHSLGLKATSMGTAFTYQGQLYDADSPAAGTYDFQFSLYVSNALPTGDTISKDDIDVIDGYFTVQLDFGSNVFNGRALWLQVAVRPGDSANPNDYATLSPRQEITPAPHAIYAKTAESIEGEVSWSQVSNRPAGLDDGDDDDDTQLSETEVDNYVSNNGYLTSYTETDPQVGNNTTNYVPKWNGSELASGTIYDNGNVGIGTTTPGAALDVSGDILADDRLLVQGTTPMSVVQDGAHSIVGMQAVGDGLNFGRLTGSNLDGKFYIQGNGNVGIGTTTPSSKLTVAGDVEITGTPGVNGIVFPDGTLLTTASRTVYIITTRTSYNRGWNDHSYPEAFAPAGWTIVEFWTSSTIRDTNNYSNKYNDYTFTLCSRELP